MFNSIRPLGALAICERMLRDQGLDDAESTARLLVCDVLHCDLHGILMADQKLTEDESGRLLELLRRVLDGEPVQYVLGYADFMGLHISVTNDVFNPAL